jgi:hypothetical protein
MQLWQLDITASVFLTDGTSARRVGPETPFAAQSRTVPICQGIAARACVGVKGLRA